MKKKRSSSDSSSPKPQHVIQTVKVEINDKTDKSLTHKFLGSKVRVKFVRGPTPPPTKERVETAAAKSVVDAALAPLKTARSTSTASDSSSSSGAPKYSFTVTGMNVSGPSRLSSLAEHLRCHGPDIATWPYVNDMKNWTFENDSKLVLWINESTRTGDRR